MNLEGMLTAEELCRRWPVDGPDPLKRWWLMLQRWREAERPLLTRHVHYELIYRDSFRLYVYSEPRVLHLVWHTYETGTHPLCAHLMLTHAPAIKRLVCQHCNRPSASTPTPSTSDSDDNTLSPALQ